MSTQPFHIRFAIDGLTDAGTTTVIGMVDIINQLEKRGRSSRTPQIRLHLLPRTRDQWKLVLAHKIGVIIVVDSANPDAFPKVKSLMQAIRQTCDAPFIVLANKQDHPDALPVDVIRKHLDLGDHIPVLPCIAKKMSSVMGVMRHLGTWATAQS